MALFYCSNDKHLEKVILIAIWLQQQYESLIKNLNPSEIINLENIEDTINEDIEYKINSMSCVIVGCKYLFENKFSTLWTFFDD